MDRIGNGHSLRRVFFIGIEPTGIKPCCNSARNIRCQRVAHHKCVGGAKIGDVALYVIKKALLRFFNADLIRDKRGLEKG